MTNNNKKPIGDMTREELLDFQGSVTAQLREVNLAIDAAKRRGRARGEFLTPEELADKERRRASLANLLAKITRQMTKLRQQRRSATTFEACFVTAARELMEPDFYDRVKARAAELQGEGGFDDPGA